MDCEPRLSGASKYVSDPPRKGRTWERPLLSKRKSKEWPPIPTPGSYSRPRHLQKIHGQTSRRPVIEINIKDLFLYRYFKCTPARPHPRLLTLVDYSFFLPITSCASLQVAVGYLLTTATAGFPEKCLFFQASGHYVTPRFLGRPRALVWGVGDPARRCYCLCDPRSQF